VNGNVSISERFYSTIGSKVVLSNEQDFRLRPRKGAYQQGRVKAVLRQRGLTINPHRRLANARDYGSR